jgi:transcription elongation factor Elf1
VKRQKKSKFQHESRIDCLWCGKQKIGRARYNDDGLIQIGAICHECGHVTWMDLKPGAIPIFTKEAPE